MLAQKPKNCATSATSPHPDLSTRHRETVKPRRGAVFRRRDCPERSGANGGLERFVFSEYARVTIVGEGRRQFVHLGFLAPSRHEIRAIQDPARSGDRVCYRTDYDFVQDLVVRGGPIRCTLQIDLTERDPGHQPIKLWLALHVVREFGDTRKDQHKRPIVRLHRVEHRGWAPLAAQAASRSVPADLATSLRNLTYRLHSRKRIASAVVNFLSRNSDRSCLGRFRPLAWLVIHGRS